MEYRTDPLESLVHNQASFEGLLALPEGYVTGKNIILFVVGKHAN